MRRSAFPFWRHIYQARLVEIHRKPCLYCTKYFATNASNSLREAVMDAPEHFQKLVVPNYNDFVQRPTEYRFLESALLLMDTVPERLALHQLGYSQLPRRALHQEAQKIRGQYNSLKDLHSCANTLKHSRSIRDHVGGEFKTTATSTGIDTADPTTWKVGGLDLVQVAHSAFAALNGIPELNERST
jgi:hypothetical protein